LASAKTGNRITAKAQRTQRKKRRDKERGEKEKMGESPDGFIVRNKNGMSKIKK
jgi:hypothetical protein